MKKSTQIFSENIKFLIAEKGVKPKDLAKKIGTSAQNVNNWMQGRSGPGTELLKAAADYFDVAAYDLTHKDITPYSDEFITVKAMDMLRKVNARTAVILTALSQLLAEKDGERLSASILNDLEKMVDDRLNADEKGE